MGGGGGGGGGGGWGGGHFIGWSSQRWPYLCAVKHDAC